MTRQEAIKVLKKELQIIDDPNVTMTASEWEEHDDYMRDALEMAIEALEQEPSCRNTRQVDLISRQAAIDAFDGVKVDEKTEYDIGYNDGIDLAVSKLSVLPSAQPFTSEQIQTMQELEAAQVEKAYELGKADRPKGHWKDGKWCSNCGEGIPTYVWDGGVSKKEVHFCIRCGARMESEEE